MLQDQIKALILGHAVGDALGVPVEFDTREQLVEHPVTKMLGYGAYDVPAGSWSDDTSMTLCLIESLARLGKVDYADIMRNFLRWMDEAEFTPTGEMFDIGRGTMQALMKFHYGTEPLKCGGASDHDNGNGSLMRIAPLVPYLYKRYGIELPEQAMQVVHEMSALTHAHARSQVACGIYVLIAVRLMEGQGLHEAITAGLQAAHRFYEGEEQFRDETVAYQRLWDAQALAKLPVEAIKSSGYVVDTLEAVIWCLLITGSYSECVLKAVNLGEDTDTVGAIAGGLAGLAYGLDSIPAEWLAMLLRRDKIENLCEKFAQSVMC